MYGLISSWLITSKCIIYFARGGVEFEFFRSHIPANTVQKIILSHFNFPFEVVTLYMFFSLIRNNIIINMIGD